MILNMKPVRIAPPYKIFLSRRFAEACSDSVQFIHKATVTRTLRFIQCVKSRCVKVSQAPCFFTILEWHDPNLPLF
jgi:hypothetical protein